MKLAHGVSIKISQRDLKNLIDDLNRGGLYYILDITFQSEYTIILQVIENPKYQNHNQHAELMEDQITPDERPEGSCSELQFSEI